MKNPPRILLILILLFVAFPVYSSAQNNQLVIHVIDVGYGNCFLIEFPNHQRMLIDAGHIDFSERILSYFDKKDINNINHAFLTHPHRDHFGGFAQFAEKFTFDHFYTNGDERNPHEGYQETIKKVKEYVFPQTLKRGDEVFIGGEDVVLKILHPENLDGETNNNCLVIWIQYKNNSFLFPCDLQTQGQDELIQAFPFIKEADVVQVPHHGGRISSLFAETFKDKIFILSVGGNEYNKPLIEELEKLEGALYSTEILGNILIESNGERITITNDF